MMCSGRRSPQHLPVVLTRHEVKPSRAAAGDVWLMRSLTYGGGLRLLECLRLRVKDVDLDRGNSRYATEKARRIE